MIIDEVLKKSPPECQTHSEKLAFAFGWFKAMEQIEAAVLAEREACAKVCETAMIPNPTTSMFDAGVNSALGMCAAAIRAR